MTLVWVCGIHSNTISSQLKILIDSYEADENKLISLGKNITCESSYIYVMYYISRRNV